MFTIFSVNMAQVAGKQRWSAQYTMRCLRSGIVVDTSELTGKRRASMDLMIDDWLSHLSITNSRRPFGVWGFSSILCQRITLRPS
jgi:hypothetical protein